MKISELIDQLQHIQSEYDDLDVIAPDYETGKHGAGIQVSVHPTLGEGKLSPNDLRAVIDSQ